MTSALRPLTIEDEPGSSAAVGDRGSFHTLVRANGSGLSGGSDPDVGGVDPDVGGVVPDVGGVVPDVGGVVPDVGGVVPDKGGVDPDDGVVVVPKPARRSRASRGSTVQSWAAVAC